MANSKKRKSKFRQSHDSAESMVFYTDLLFRACKYESQKKAKWRFCLDLAPIQCILGPQINTRVYIGFIMNLQLAAQWLLQAKPKSGT